MIQVPNQVPVCGGSLLVATTTPEMEVKGPYEEMVERVIGNMVYLPGHRFHCVDDRIGPLTWRREKDGFITVFSLTSGLEAMINSNAATQQPRRGQLQRGIQ